MGWHERDSGDIPAAPASHQPQAGAYFDFPYDVDEFWVQTWYRFDSNWDTLPYWIAPDGTQTSNEDHKSMFVFERGFGKRWEWKIARYGMVASAATHDIHYQYFYDPPYAHPITQSEKVTHQQVYPNGGYYAPTDAWDNQWHEIRWHCKQGASSDGEIELWWDGVKVINATGLNTQSGGDFFRFVMGANRNSGPSEDMGFQVGPVNTWNSDPGW